MIYWKKNSYSRKVTHKFLEVFYALLSHGFSLQESLAVIDRSNQFEKKLIVDIKEHLIKGTSLATAFQALLLSPTERSQIHLAEHYGSIPDALKRIVAYQKLADQKKQILKKVAVYPLMLLLFVFSVLMGMRSFLLPQLLASGMINSSHLGIRFIQAAPYWLIIVILFFIAVFLGFNYFFRKKSVLTKAVFLANLPFFGPLYRYYLTSFFALEWGKLFQQGLEIRQIIGCMKKIESGSLMHALAQELDNHLTHGSQLSQKLSEYTFLTNEFPLIVFQGEVKGKLGEELFIYSQLLLDTFFQKIEQWIQWIQPLVFLFITLLIIGIYAAMFLPIYGNIQGVIK